MTTARRAALALALTALTPVLAAAPALAHRSAHHAASAADPIATAIADPTRSDKARGLDEGRMPAKVLAFAGVKPGQTVADVFAGGGYYSVLLADVVGPKGMVYALNPAAENDAKAWEAILPHHANLKVFVAPLDSPQLAPGSVDLLFTHLNYHDLYWESEKYHFPHTDVPTVLKQWFAMVKPGGHVVIVDHAGPAGDPRVIADKLHRIDPARVKADMAAAGFVLEGESDVLHRSDDDFDKDVFDPKVRGKTDRFALKFRRP